MSQPSGGLIVCNRERWLLFLGFSGVQGPCSMWGGGEGGLGGGGSWEADRQEE